MNRQKLLALASDWTRVAKDDIRTKVINFMRENDASQRELAYVLGISDGELEQIINGNGEITLSTFAKLLIATGNALEIKPIEETPMGTYDNIPERPMPPLPRPNPFTRPRMTERPHFERPPFPFNPFGHDEDPEFEDDIDDEGEEEFDVDRPITPNRQSRGTMNRPNPRPFESTSPFASMPRERLVGIINSKLWDSEIDTNRASLTELVRFLEEKDRRMKEYKRMSELENDPKIMEFKNRLKKTVENNPQLKNWVKKFINNVEE